MWKQVILDVPDDLMDAVVGDLAGDGVAGVWEEPAGEGLTRLVLYFEIGSDVEGASRRIRDIFARGPHPTPVIAIGVVEDCDWTEEWKKSYTCFPIGTSFFVIPSWIDLPCPPDRLPIRIDPGQAFGTGTHETTQLTIEALERWVDPRHTVLDVGTGSGILALAARLLGAHEVIACDIDPVAVQVALANIERNTEPDVWAFCGSADAVADKSIHLLLGNLTADVIVALIPDLHRVLAVKGIAILSGILVTQREDVLAACATFGWVIHQEIVRGEWLALVAEKH